MRLTVLLCASLLAACDPRPRPVAAPGWTTRPRRDCPRVEVVRDDLAGASWARTRMFLGCGAHDLCALYRDGEAGPLVHLRLDFAGQVTARRVLPWPELSPNAALAAALDETDTVIVAADPTGPVTVARHTADGARAWVAEAPLRRPAMQQDPWDTITAGEPWDMRHRIATTAATVALLAAHDEIHVIQWDRTTGAPVRDDRSPAAGPRGAVCLASRPDRVFAATLTPVDLAPRPGYHARLDAMWLATSSGDPPMHTAVYLPKHSPVLACSLAADHAELALIPYNEPSTVRITPTHPGFAAPTPMARQITQADTAVTMLAADDLTLVAWEDRVLHPAHAPSLRSWLTFLDEGGRPTHVRAVAESAFNVSLTATSAGPYAAYQSDWQHFSLARVGCDRTRVR